MPPFSSVEHSLLLSPHLSLPPPLWCCCCCDSLCIVNDNEKGRERLKRCERERERDTRFKTVQEEGSSGVRREKGGSPQRIVLPLLMARGGQCRYPRVCVSARVGLKTTPAACSTNKGSWVNRQCGNEAAQEAGKYSAAARLIN